LEGNEESVCACDEEAEDRGVHLNEFLKAFSEDNEQKELKLPSVPPALSPSLKPSTSLPPSAESSLSPPTTRFMLCL
jgi:hypothetical protein